MNIGDLPAPNTCYNCKFFIVKDHSLWRYDVTISCTENMFESEEFTGDGDYYDQTAQRHVCQHHQIESLKSKD